MKQPVIICRCEAVSQEEIEQAIREGARTLDGVKRRTRAGMGICQGRTCAQLVARIIAARTGTPPGEVELSRARPPVRPVDVAALDGAEQ